MPTPPCIPGISNEGIGWLSWTDISITVSSRSPALNLFLKLSLVAGVAFFPTSVSKTRSSEDNWDLASTSFLFFSLTSAIAISIKSLIICSTSFPTYPTSVNLVASTFINGASESLDNLLEISVFPTPVGPTIKIFLGSTSSFNSSGNSCRLHLLRKAIATAFLASP